MKFFRLEVFWVGLGGGGREWNRDYKGSKRVAQPRNRKKPTLFKGIAVSNAYRRPRACHRTVENKTKPPRTLLDGDNFLYFGDLLTYKTFHTLFEGHNGGWARMTGTLKTHLDDPVISDTHQFNVSPIGLQHGAQLIQNRLYTFLHRTLQSATNLC